MEHQMRLFEEPFESIKAGRKTVEVRLFDEKRRQIQIGDMITFTKIPDNTETITVKVVDLQTFSTFKELYETIPASKVDLVDWSIEEILDGIYQIYSPEEEKKWGTLAIEIELLDE